MNPKNPNDERSTENEPERRDETPEAPDRSAAPPAAPPMEREHETQAGALEEDERRKREGR